MASELVGSLATEINFGFAPTEDSRKHINSLWVGQTWPTEVMRSWEVWARSAGDVSVADAGTGPEAEPEAEPEAGYSTASRRGSLSRTRDAMLF